MTVTGLKPNLKQMETTRPKTPDEHIKTPGRYPGFWREIFEQAEQVKASDIHVEALHTGLRVRLRVDGILRVIATVKDVLEIESLLICLKNIANLDTSRRRVLQDNSFDLSYIGASYRVTLSPGYDYGECLVFRVIRDSELRSLDQLGLSPEAREDVEWAISQHQGFFLVTGPTGSGKSTTLQACMMHLDRDSKKVITFENPVERKLEGVCHQKITEQFSWEDAAKGVLRSDPDIILFGEIRDRISAKFAVEAAQTGHFVISTLHTNNVIETVERLIALDVDKYLIADSLVFISAQRLMQKLCDNCKVPYKEHFKRNFQGCDRCCNGYKGRISLLEYCLKPDPEFILNYQKDEFKKLLKQTLLGEMEKSVVAGVLDYPTFESVLRKGSL